MIEMTTSLARSLATLTGFENHLLSGLGPPGWTKVECWSGRGTLHPLGYRPESAELAELYWSRPFVADPIMQNTAGVISTLMR
jgi:hypothetical protein